jgi:hypothetical protein
MGSRSPVVLYKKDQCVNIAISLLLICLFAHIFSRFLLYSACVSCVMSTTEGVEYHNRHYAQG